jgi:RHS repeat-associated protein
MGGVCYDADFGPYGKEQAYTNTCTQKYKFTGKERDAETGNDYFGARYYENNLGRFASADPLMASAHASNPQTWNRYAYTLNNPLRFVDPDGMEVPDSCAKNQGCAIVVKVNVVYDKTVNNGKGLTDLQKQAFEKDQIAKATKDYGTSNIKLDVSYTAGTYSVGADGTTHVTGLRSDSLNIVASTATPSGAAGDSGVDRKTDTAVTFIIVNTAPSRNIWPLFTNTTEHELAHQFLGDVYRQWNPFAYVANEFVVDAKVAAQAAGDSQQSFRVGLEPRRYAAPLNPELNKPQQ